MRQPIWDLPIRLCHWLLAALIPFSWWSAKSDHSDWHIRSGIAILTLLIFRFLWGIFGSSTARFANFVRGPASVLSYFRGNWRGIGHNPLGALSVLALLGATAVQAGLGLFTEDEDGLARGPLALLIGSDTAEQVRDIHAVFFYVLLGLIVLHVAAILFYRLRGRHLIMPMITGRGPIEPGTGPMEAGKWWAALICLIVAVGISRWIVAGAPPFSP